MRFAFDEEQRQFAAAVREYLERECTPKELRAVAAGESGRSAERWRGLTEMGVIGLTAPEDAGGLGLSEVDLVLLMEEAGRAALPEPLLETTAVAIPMLMEAPPGEGRARWLSAAANGEALITVSLKRAPLASRADMSDVILIQTDDTVRAVAPTEVTLIAQQSVDPLRRLYSIDGHESAGSTIVEGGAVATAAEKAFDRGALGVSAQLLGLADRMIVMATEYAKQREQFGKAIGSYQAVKHHLATALVRLEFARPVVYRAAWSVANDVPDRSRDVSIAKAVASEAALVAMRTSLQVHGAIGYTEEHDLHLYLRRARALASAWGTASWHRDRVAAQVLGG